MDQLEERKYYFYREIKALDNVASNKIKDLSLQALTLERYAPEIARQFQRSIREATSDEKRLALLYLMDGIIKEHNPFFLESFAEVIPNLFLDIYNRVDRAILKKICKLYKIWEIIFPPVVFQSIADTLLITSERYLDDSDYTKIANYRQYYMSQFPPQPMYPDPVLQQRRMHEQVMQSQIYYPPPVPHPEPILYQQPHQEYAQVMPPPPPVANLYEYQGPGLQHFMNQSELLAMQNAPPVVPAPHPPPPVIQRPPPANIYVDQNRSFFATLFKFSKDLQLKTEGVNPINTIDWKKPGTLNKPLPGAVDQVYRKAQYQCRVCGLRFLDRVKLGSHLDRHFEERSDLMKTILRRSKPPKHRGLLVRREDWEQGVMDMFSKEHQAEEGQPQIIDDPQRADAVQGESILPYDPQHVRDGTDYNQSRCFVCRERFEIEFMDLKGRQDWFMRDSVRAKVTVKETQQEMQELLHKRCLGYLRTISVHI